ncbi:MAG: hypothetical protein J7507_08765 [Pseudoxanthomonas sp.]|nr:hypothetical protein [Pseudoxanthomonas sp.]
MAFPAFFDQAPVLRLHDGLSQLLGATPDGIIEYRYADAVRLAGHSCPTVAGAWLCARAGLRVLYGEAVPERGGIAVTLAEAEDAGVAGVIGQVLTLVTGAAGAGGFKGLAGRHARSNLLRYGDTPADALQLRRLDSGATVAVELDTSVVPAEPGQREMLGRILAGEDDPALLGRFAEAWQDRVRRMLVGHADDPALVRVRRLA